MLYVAMTGASQAMRAQAAVSNNLANVTTSGFRADLIQFRAMPVYGAGQPSRVYAMAERPGVDFSPGSVQTTGRDLDVAIAGEGWLAVQAPDGSEAYTRAGDLRVTSAGLLQTAAGHPVLGNGGPVAVPPHDKLEIGADGTISILPLGQEGSAMVLLDRIKLVQPALEALVKGPDGLARGRDGESFDPDASVRVTSGAVEGSNVNAVDGLVSMIELQRHYEAQVRMMNTAKEGDEATGELLRLG
jgi:flagellar basal-body rod protein FlgF